MMYPDFSFTMAYVYPSARVREYSFVEVSFISDLGVSPYLAISMILASFACPVNFSLPIGFKSPIFLLC